MLPERLPLASREFGTVWGVEEANLPPRSFDKIHRNQSIECRVRLFWSAQLANLPWDKLRSISRFICTVLVQIFLDDHFFGSLWVLDLDNSSSSSLKELSCNTSLAFLNLAAARLALLDSGVRDVSFLGDLVELVLSQVSSSCQSSSSSARDSKGLLLKHLSFFDKFPNMAS